MNETAVSSNFLEFHTWIRFRPAKKKQYLSWLWRSSLPPASLPFSWWPMETIFSIYIRINPFAPGDFAEKRDLKLVQWFSGTVLLKRAKTYHKPVYRSYTSRPSDPDAKYQFAKFRHALSLLPSFFAFLASFFFSCWAFSRLRFGGKSF